MKSEEIIRKHLKYKDKNMQELIKERNMEQLKSQNELRKRYLPEKYNPNIDE